MPSKHRKRPVAETAKLSHRWLFVREQNGSHDGTDWHRLCTVQSGRRCTMEKMLGAVFHGKNDLRVQEVPRPHPGTGEAVIRVKFTTICGTDIHILKGEYPVQPGL